MRYDVIENTDLNIEKVEMKCDGEIAKGLCKPLPNKSFAFVLCGKSGSGNFSVAKRRTASVTGCFFAPRAAPWLGGAYSSSLSATPAARAVGILQQ